MELIIDQMKRISLSEDPLPILIDIKTKLIASSSKDLVTLLEVDYPLTYIHPLFDILNSNNNEQINTCVDVLNYILSKINARLTLENLYNQYVLCLNHPHESVRLMVLKQLLYCSNDVTAAQLLVSQPTLINALIKSIGDSSMVIITIANKALVKLCSYPNATNRIFTSESNKILRDVMLVSDSYRFHVFELCVKIGTLDEHSLEVIHNTGIYECFFRELTDGDVLTKLNAIELISEFGSTLHGLRYLQEQEAVTKLSYLLVNAKNDPMAAVLLPGLLKFYGRVGALHPSFFIGSYVGTLKEIMRISCDFSGDVEPQIQLIAFETLAHVGSTTEGKTMLNKFTVEIEQSLSDFCSHMSSFPSELKVRVLEALAKLFYLPLEEQTEDLLVLLERWFEHLWEEPAMSVLHRLAKQPFPESLCAVLTFILSLSMLPFGVSRTATEPGLLEWLLYRDSCRDKESKELRYDIITILHRHNTTIKSVLDEGTQCRIETFYKQGAFFVETETTIAFEQGDG